jgi:Asp-tRNA(Asn)/Glu-tRNA(Gln) amidotransferase A subunit family amidase
VRLAEAALGSDSGGSIRIPAACCGIVGFKPSRGLVPLDGCFPLAPTFDHAGPMGRDVRTCVRMLETLAPGSTRPELASLDEVDVGTAWVERADPLVATCLKEELRLRRGCSAWVNPGRQGDRLDVSEHAAGVPGREGADQP